MSRGRVEKRAQEFYKFLTDHLDEGFNIAELLAGVNKANPHADRITDGDTTRRAIRRARDLATEAGYHFPPAIAGYGYDFKYRITTIPGDALRPSLQMARVERGVRLRKEDGLEFMRRERGKLPPDKRPIVNLYLTIHDEARKAMAAIQRGADDFVEAMLKETRPNRKDDDGA